MTDQAKDRLAEIAKNAIKERDVAAEARVYKALDHIQQAQNDIASACAELSALVGGIPVWKATSKMHGQVRELWYRVERFRDTGRYKLDSLNVEALREKTAGAQRSGS